MGNLEYSRFQILEIAYPVDVIIYDGRREVCSITISQLVSIFTEDVYIREMLYDQGEEFSVMSSTTNDKLHLINTSITKPLAPERSP